MLNLTSIGPTLLAVEGISDEISASLLRYGGGSPRIVGQSGALKS
jgi:hypothetical protein